MKLTARVGVTVPAAPPVKAPVATAKAPPIASQRLSASSDGFSSETVSSHVTYSAHEDPIRADPKIVKELAGTTGKEARAYVANLRLKNPAEYKLLLANVRAGMIKDPKIAMPLTVDLAASSTWGKGPGKEQIKNLEKMFDAGNVKFGEVADDNHAVTTPGDISKTQNGMGTSSSITLDNHLLDAPEVAAAALAHESTHALHYKKGDNPSLLQSETEGEMALAAVWNGFGKEKFRGVNAGATMEVEFTSRHGGDINDMRAEVATQYAKNFAAWPRPDHEEGVNRAVEMMGEAQRLDPNYLDKISNDDAPQLWTAYADYIKANPEARADETIVAAYNKLREQTVSPKPE